MKLLHLGMGIGHADGVRARDDKHHDGVSIRFIPDRCGCPATPKQKKPTRLNTLRYSTTSAYSSTSPPAFTGMPFIQSSDAEPLHASLALR